MGWIDNLFDKLFGNSQRPTVNEYTISPEVAKAILLRRDITSSRVDFWNEVTPRWADFFDRNNPNHSIPIFRPGEAAYDVLIKREKEYVCNLARNSLSNTWVLRTKNVPKAMGFLKEMRIL